MPDTLPLMSHPGYLPEDVTKLILTAMRLKILLPEVVTLLERHAIEQQPATAS